MLGSIVGNYKITKRLSRGGMGMVYGAEHTLIGRLAAIKILHPEFSGNKDIVNRFFNEAKAPTSIKHPGIVEIFDYGYLPAGDGYIIMEFLDGMSLGRRLKRGGRFSEGEAAMLIRGVCSALAAAHQKGIVHRDLKPDNIFLIEDTESPLGERPKVLDFGIAKLTDVGLAGTGTKTGAVMGTPTYMSPEQCRGTGEVDLRADLYSLGCILYELTCGRPPFSNLGAGELIGAHLHVVPDRPSKYEPQISREMEQLIMSLLEKHPENRPQTAPELSRQLARIANTHGFQVTSTHPSGVSSLTKLQQAQKLPPMRDDHRPSKTEFAPEIEVTPATSRFSAADADVDESQAAVEKPTTLSGSATSHPVIERPRRRRGWFVAGAVLVAAGAVAVVVMTAGGSGPGTRVEPATPVRVAPPVVTARPPVVASPPPPITSTPEPPAAPTPAVAAPTPAAVDAPPAKLAHKHTHKKVAPVTPKPADKPVDKPADKINGPIETDL